MFYAIKYTSVVNEEKNKKQQYLIMPIKMSVACRFHDDMNIVYIHLKKCREIEGTKQLIPKIKVYIIYNYYIKKVLRKKSI